MCFNNFIKYLFVVPVIGYCMICTGYAAQHTYTITNTSHAYNDSDNRLRKLGFYPTDNDSGRGNWLEVADEKYLNCGNETEGWLVLAPDGAKVRYEVQDIVGNEAFLDAVDSLVGDDADWKKEPDELTDDDTAEWVSGGISLGAGGVTAYLGYKLIEKLGPKVLVAGGGGLGVLAGVGVIAYGVLDEVDQHEHALTIESNGRLVLKCSDDLWMPHSIIIPESCDADQTALNTFDTSGDPNYIYVFGTDVTLYYDGEDRVPFEQICVCKSGCQKPDGSCEACNPQCQHYDDAGKADYQTYTGWALTKNCDEHKNYKISDTQPVLTDAQQTALGNHLSVKNDAKCDYKCTAAGWEITPNHSYYCDPTQQPAIAEDKSYTFSCVDTAETVKQKQNAKAAAAAEAKDKCATAICEASNGTYKHNKCMCGDDVCTSTTSVNDTSYKYCGGTGTKNGRTVEGHYCGQNKKGEKRLAEGKPGNFANMAAFNEAINTAKRSSSCITNDAADGDAADTISALAKTLDAIEDAYGLSKWRTVDGKFNYARLASDATAAVVLGTTGALVTSSVVKKKQVEAGFESLECTVGGQHVGDWGDVFRIDGK